MYKKLSVLLLVMTVGIGASAAKASLNNSGFEVSNNYFSFTLPDAAKGTYTVNKENNGIFICEKISEKSGLGGLAFGIKIFKNPEDYAKMTGSKKLGELTDKNGTIYDMVLMRPSEIRYGEGKQIEENYNRLYNLADNIEIIGINGNKYVKQKGMKGKDLYSDILNNYKGARLGYVYYDINSDGIDELIIGKITNGKSKGIIHEFYTMVNRKPKLILRLDDTDRYFICNDNFVCREEYAKNQNRMTVYVLENNSEYLHSQMVFTYDKIKDKKNPWFIRYGGFSGKNQHVDKKVFNETKSIYANSYKKFDYIPFSK